MKDARSTSRLRFLRRSLGLAAGAAGVGAVAYPATAAARPSKETLTLQARGLHLDSPKRKHGDLPAPGEQFHLHGELLDVKGKRAGVLAGIATHVVSPFAEAGLGTMSFEHHVLRLHDGSLFATGHTADGAGSFAIVGGTGRYAGASGSYTSRQSVHGLGGDGSATFALTLMKA